MSQVFSADSVSVPAAVSVATSGETVILTGNFLNPPFQNAKAAVWCNFTLLVGTGTTSVIVRLRRNPNAENQQIMGSNTVNVTAGNFASLSLQGADVIPDGRPVQYAITVAPTGASATGSVTNGNITAMLISG